MTKFGNGRCFEHIVTAKDLYNFHIFIDSFAALKCLSKMKTTLCSKSKPERSLHPQNVDNLVMICLRNEQLMVFFLRGFVFLCG